MSLPIAGKPRPQEPATHQPLDLDRLMKLGVAVEDAADEADAEVVTLEMLEELGEEMGVAPGHLLAAAVMTTDLQIARDDEVNFVVCAGGCQGWGALDRIDELLAIRRQRAEAGERLFGVCAKNCLDKCQQAPAVFVHGPDGAAIIDRATRDKLEEAVAELLA